MQKKTKVSKKEIKMKCSCLDIGSNTIKVSIFEKRGKHWETVAYLGEPTGLIGYVKMESGHRYLSEEGIEALVSALGRLIAFSEEKESEQLFAFATASLRGVENIDDIQNVVYSSYGIHLDVISGEEEALCSLRGLLSDERCEGVSEGVMIDMGGGSTEVVYFVNGREPIIRSLPFGSLSLTNGFVEQYPPKESEAELISAYVSEQMTACRFVKGIGCPVFLIGGTARAASKLTYAIKPRKKEILKVSDFEMLYTKMITDAKTRTLAETLIPKRVKTITAGAVAYFEILKYISPEEIFVSESGVREGYLERILI